MVTEWEYTTLGILKSDVGSRYLSCHPSSSRKVSHMAEETPTQTALICSQCGRAYAQSDLVQIAGNWVCGDCKPAYLSRVVGGGAASSRWHYGGFWIRFVARMIDAVLLVAVQASIAAIFFGAFGAEFSPRVLQRQAIGLRLSYQVMSYGIAFLYEVMFLHYKGGTLGKLALGLRVVQSDGDPLSWGVCIGRYFMYLVSGLILLIGYIMAGFDPEKRALHDRVCDTRVVYRRSLG
jgi:uncharacterized RDD family membrane protein YckC